ncbi:D-3-phosphoglycerate dehydrogenase [Sitophilus oryzae]|uniref:D-3-phosphoglycerate dehydrogenase n=1 Tax=Sitophilus oryzae TaxID=7048 RepID=A0A6J2Y438_SITOR|nr:D-3-phosphoglycerate dehydrogenase [Sitophilus oryzae]
MDIKRVLVADAVDPACTELLKKYSIQVDCKYKLSKEQLIAEIKVKTFKKNIHSFCRKQNRNLIVKPTKLRNEQFDTYVYIPHINFSTPGGNSISACELTCALITDLARNISTANASLKAGRWDRKIYAGHELYGKTLAIIGLGRIGREVAIRMQSWGMTTIGYDPIVTAEESKKFNVEFMPLEAIWARADYITVHTPLIDATRNLINGKVLNACKKGVRIINVARGGIVNEADLLAALKSGQCGGAGIDVFEQEPPTNAITLEVIAHDKVVATPHLGASTAEAQIRVAVEVSEQIIALTGKSTEYTSAPGIINRSVL